MNKNNITNTIDSWRKVIDNINIDTKKEEAILSFKKICTECGEDYFNLLDYNTIDIAREYVLIGMECDKAFKYAVDYGRTGLKIIEALQYDFHLKLFG